MEIPLSYIMPTNNGVEDKDAQDYHDSDAYLMAKMKWYELFDRQLNCMEYIAPIGLQYSGMGLRERI